MKIKEVGRSLLKMETIFLDERISISPVELNAIGSPEEIRHLLEKKMREKYEGRCHSSGYVQPGSVVLLTKSMGIHEHGRFTGNILYDCRASCKAYIPIAKSILNVKIIRINKMGAYALLATEGEEQSMKIQIPRDLHLGDVTFDTLKEGSVVSVEILRSRFQINDPFIQALAKLAPAPVAAA
jgi:DNA-directed RNA polymerase subunit E'/Rpb7